MDQEYLFVPKANPLEGHLVYVTVKVATKRSRWTPGCFYPRRPDGPGAVVHGGAFRSLSAAEVKERARWTHVAS